MPTTWKKLAFYGDSIVLDSGNNVELHKALSTNLSWSGLTATLTAGEALVIGDLCYRKADAKMYKAIASDVAKMPAMAMATGTINQDAMGVFLLHGYIRNDAWTWTEHGVRIFVSAATAGLMTETPPTGANTYIQEVAIIIDSVIGGGATDEVFFNPSFTSLQDTPTNNEMGSAPTSNWAYDHTAAAGAHHAAVTVSAPISKDAGQALSIADGAITYAKIQDVSATDKLLGRSSAGAGDVEEIACTAAGRALLDDANAAAQLATLGAAATTQLPNRNAIINGGMDIWQRGTATLTNPAHGLYFVDRFQLIRALGDGTFDLLQSAETPAAGFPFNYSVKIDCTAVETAVAATEFAGIQQKVEGYDFKRFAGETATLSFWVKAVKTGIYCVAFRNTDSSRSYVSEYTINAASTWERKTITLTFNAGGTWYYTNTVGVTITWMLLCGSTLQIATANKNTWQTGTYIATDAQVNGLDNTNNNFWLTGVQLELGSVATPFEQRPYAHELALCQRYYERIVPGAAYGAYATGYCQSTTVAQTCLVYKTKRAEPTFGYSGADDFLLSVVAGNIASAAVAANFLNPVSCVLRIEVAAGLTVGEGCLVIGENSTTHYLELIAEM
jgi:hypothetical protein